LHNMQLAKHQLLFCNPISILAQLGIVRLCL
jgi:hypothetical protein